MKTLGAVLLVALVVVLSFIAYDLHRVAAALEPAGVVSGALVDAARAPAETHEQKVRRQMRLQRELDDDLSASLEAGDRLAASSRKPAVKR